MHFKALATSALVLVTLTVATAVAPGTAHAQAGLPSLEVKLTKDSVKRLLAAIPELAAKSGAQAQMMATGVGDPSAMTPEEAEKLQAIIKKHGFEMDEFAIQVSTLLATYFALDPKAYDDYLPSEKQPAIRKILDDPKVGKAQKDSLKAQIEFAQKNKEELRAQLLELVTPDTKKVVKPLISKVKSALQKAELASTGK